MSIHISTQTHTIQSNHFPLSPHPTKVAFKQAPTGTQMSTPKRAGYKDVKQTILARVRDKTWPLGTVLPGEVALAQEFGCARATINRAMRELADEGILDRKRRAGTTVLASPLRHAKVAVPSVRAEIEATGATYRYSLVSRTIQTAPDWLRARLSLTSEAQAVHLRCMHYADNAPYQFEDRWIVLETVPTARDEPFEAIGPNDWLIAEMPLTDIELTFSAALAGSDYADFLDIPPESPVFQIERCTWLNGNPVTLARMTHPGSHRLRTAL